MGAETPNKTEAPPPSPALQKEADQLKAIEKVHSELRALREELEKKNPLKEERQKAFVDAFKQYQEALKGDRTPAAQKALELFEKEFLELAKLYPSFQQFIDTQLKLNTLGGKEYPGSAPNALSVKVDDMLAQAQQNPKLKETLGGVLPYLISLVREGLASYLANMNIEPIATMGRDWQWRIFCDKEKQKKGQPTSLDDIADNKGKNIPILPPAEEGLGLPAGTRGRWEACQIKWINTCKAAKAAKMVVSYKAPGLENILSEEDADKYKRSLDPQAAPSAKPGEKPADNPNEKKNIGGLEFTGNEPLQVTDQNREFYRENALPPNPAKKITLNKEKIGVGASDHKYKINYTPGTVTDMKLLKPESGEPKDIKLSINGKMIALEAVLKEIDNDTGGTKKQNININASGAVTLS